MSPNDKTTNIEKKVNDIDEGAYNNQIYYIDDYTVSTYHSYSIDDFTEDNEMYVINLKTLNKTVYEGNSEFACKI